MFITKRSSNLVALVSSFIAVRDIGEALYMRNLLYWNRLSAIACLIKIDCICVYPGTIGSGATVYMLASRNPYRTVDVPHSIYRSLFLECELRLIVFGQFCTEFEDSSWLISVIFEWCRMWYHMQHSQARYRYGFPIGSVLPCLLPGW